MSQVQSLPGGVSGIVTYVSSNFHSVLRDYTEKVYSIPPPQNKYNICWDHVTLICPDPL